MLVEKGLVFLLKVGNGVVLVVYVIVVGLCMM